MGLPLMDSDPTVLSRRTGGLPLTVDDAVQAAWDRLRASGEVAAVVLRGRRPWTVVTREALERAVAAGRGAEPIGRVAGFVVVPVDRSADALATVHEFTRAAWDWLRHERDR